jgi:hypothetical protein
MKINVASVNVVDVEIKQFCKNLGYNCTIDRIGYLKIKFNKETKRYYLDE